MPHGHVSWPLCPDCDGAGAVMINPTFHQRASEPCKRCGGAGRVKPDGWKDPVWEPPGADGSPGWLIDPGSDPELQGRPTKPARRDRRPTRLIPEDLNPGAVPPMVVNPSGSEEPS